MPKDLKERLVESWDSAVKRSRIDRLAPPILNLHFRTTTDITRQTSMSGSKLALLVEIRSSSAHTTDANP